MGASDDMSASAIGRCGMQTFLAKTEKPAIARVLFGVGNRACCLSAPQAQIPSSQKTRGMTVPSLFAVTAA